MSTEVGGCNIYASQHSRKNTIKIPVNIKSDLSSWQMNTVFNHNIGHSLKTNKEGRKVLIIKSYDNNTRWGVQSRKGVNLKNSHTFQIDWINSWTHHLFILGAENICITGKWKEHKNVISWIHVQWIIALSIPSKLSACDELAVCEFWEHDRSLSRCELEVPWQKACEEENQGK